MANIKLFIFASEKTSVSYHQSWWPPKRGEKSYLSLARKSVFSLRRFFLTIGRIKKSSIVKESLCSVGGGFSFKPTATWPFSYNEVFFIQSNNVYLKRWKFLWVTKSKNVLLPFGRMRMFPQNYFYFIHLV